MSWTTILMIWLNMFKSSVGQLPPRNPPVEDRPCPPRPRREIQEEINKRRIYRDNK